MIKYDESKSRYRYFDKYGQEINEGDYILIDGKYKRIYRTEDGELGTDATNPLWVKSGKAIPCEYGIYPLTTEETEESIVFETDIVGSGEMEEVFICKFNGEIIETDKIELDDEYIPDLPYTGTLKAFEIMEDDLLEIREYFKKQIQKHKDKKAINLLEKLETLEEIKN